MNGTGLDNDSSKTCLYSFPNPIPNFNPALNPSRVFSVLSCSDPALYPSWYP